MAAVTPGWPRDLPPRGTEEFEAKVTGWLLDRGPAELRGSPLRHLPIALARVVSHVTAAEIDGMRAAYASARVELSEHLTPDQIAVVQSSLEAQGARLLGVQREVALVEEALVDTARRSRHQGVNPGSIA
jgi:hypothetical protein